MKRDLGNLRDHQLEFEAIALAVVDPMFRAGLREDYFDREKYRLLFKAIRAITSISSDVSPSHITDQLFEADPWNLRTPESGDHDPRLSYLAVVLELVQPRTLANKPGILARLGQLATLRATDKALVDALATIHAPIDFGEGEEPYAKKYAEVGRHISSLDQLSGISGAVLQPLVKIEDKSFDQSATPSGFPGLDYVMSIGGLPKGQTTIVRAWHKGGKSLTMRSMFYRDLLARRNALYVSFADLNEYQLRQLLIQAHTGWRKPPEQYTTAEGGYYQLRNEFLDPVNGQALSGTIINAFGASAETTIEDILQLIKANQDFMQWDKIYFDYAQKMGTNDPRATNEVAEQNIIARKVSNFASHLGSAAFVIGSQLTQGNKQTGEVAKTKYSRKWEEEAGLVLTARKAEENIELEVTYNRWGEMTPEGGDKRLVVQDLKHDYRHHIIKGFGKPYWATNDSKEAFSPKYDAS